MEMEYALVYLVPSVAMIGYHVYLNAKLKKQYDILLRKMSAVCKKADLKEEHQQVVNSRELIVTHLSIKKLEQILISLEHKVGVTNRANIGNQYKPRGEKLRMLAKRVKKVQTKCTEPQNEEVLAEV